MQTNEVRFGFGQNWADYIKSNFSEERMLISQSHLLGFLKMANLQGKSFLDIGCGSGLHSFAAFKAGATNIVSIDYDENSVATTRYLHEYAGRPVSWKIYQGSVLDEQFVKSLGEFDIVYSWGVLHHTGDMWNAIRNAAIPVSDEGVFYIALYTTDVYINPTPEFWLKVKQKYNRSNAFTKKAMEYAYAYKNLFKPMLLKRQNPFKFMKDYKESRGMSFWHDIKDWLGGWPMEFAGLEETKRFCKEDLDLELINISAGEANTEYLFRRKGSVNYWYEVNRNWKFNDINAPFEHIKGHCWAVKLPDLMNLSDNNEKPRQSTLMLFENKEPVGFAHAPLQHIEAHGKSRYCHWNEKLFFSTTDNSDPNTNGREYSYAIIAKK